MRMQGIFMRMPRIFVRMRGGPDVNWDIFDVCQGGSHPFAHHSVLCQQPGFEIGSPNWVCQTCIFMGTLSKSGHHRYWVKSKVWWWIKLLFDRLLVPRVLHSNIFLDSILHRVLQLLEVHLNTYTSNNLGQSNKWLGHKGASPDFLFVLNYCRWSNPADKDKTLHLELALILASLLVKLDDRVLLQVLVQLHRGCKPLQTSWMQCCVVKRARKRQIAIYLGQNQIYDIDVYLRRVYSKANTPEELMV